MGGVFLLVFAIRLRLAPSRHAYFSAPAHPPSLRHSETIPLMFTTDFCAAAHPPSPISVRFVL